MLKISSRFLCILLSLVIAAAVCTPAQAYVSQYDKNYLSQSQQETLEDLTDKWWNAYNTQNQDGMADAHDAAEKIRAAENYSGDADGSEYSFQADGFTEQTVTFPADDADKTESNKAVFEINPFTVRFALPGGWTVRAAEADEAGTEQALYLYSGAFSKVYVFDADDNCVGAVGYNTFEQYEGAEDDPRAVYGQIALGNDYRFDVRDSYVPVISTDSMATSIEEVYYSKSFLDAFEDDASEKTNKGILSCDKDLSVYAAFEFEDSSLTEEQWKTVAESISFRNTEP